MEREKLIRRIDDLLEKRTSASITDYRTGAELFSATLSLLCSLFGQNSPQVESLEELRNRAYKFSNSQSINANLVPGVAGVLNNLRAEIEGGLLGSLKQQLSGEILSDFILLARGATAEKGDGAKNVAAVLAAAVFEDTIRRMGSELAGVQDRPDLQDVIIELKKEQILEGPQIAIAQSYLKFRNDALHADWDKIERSSIQSILGFVEQLLLKHFG